MILHEQNKSSAAVDVLVGASAAVQWEIILDRLEHDAEMEGLLKVLRISGRLNESSGKVSSMKYAPSPRPAPKPDEIMVIKPIPTENFSQSSSTPRPDVRLSEAALERQARLVELAMLQEVHEKLKGSWNSLASKATGAIDTRLKLQEDRLRTLETWARENKVTTDERVLAAKLLREMQTSSKH